MPLTNLNQTRTEKINYIRAAVKDNVESSKTLIKQAKNLAGVIEKHEDGKSRDELVAIQEQIDKALDTLLRSTNILLDSYIELLRY